MLQMNKGPQQPQVKPALAHQQAMIQQQILIQKLAMQNLQQVDKSRTNPKKYLEQKCVLFMA